MFNLEHSIAQWRGQMVAAGVATSESLNELETHLRDDVEHSIRSGLSAEVAFDSAVRHLGGGDALKAEFEKLAGAGRRHIIYRGFCIGIGAFLLSTAVCYFAILPHALVASQAYAKWLGLSPIGQQSHEYILFAFKSVLGLGLSVEIPVVILTLVKLGVVDYRLLSKRRKYVIVLNLVLGAVLTTPEVITQLLMFVTLQTLYEISVWVARSWACQDKECGAQP